MRLAVLLSVVVLMTSGCQGLRIWDQQIAGPSTSVMSLWDRYQHCRATDDLEAKETAARKLTVMAQMATVTQPSPFPFPEVLHRHSNGGATRYSVDPMALSASCSLSAGHAALQAGRARMAAEMFQLILSNHFKPEYAYYVEEAKKGMIQAEIRLLVRSPELPYVLPVSR